ncbi:MAG: response regulator [Steroidobacteraceae bacterium]|jgi:two-component system, chemotaxis family, chemotaxis protein CheY
MSKRILIVDDCASARQVAGVALTHAGYEVVEANDGEDGLRKLSGRLHLIITDLNMPRMNGFEFLKAVKAHPSYKFTPVIMLTTEAGEDKKSQGRAAGAKAWITKPFQPQTLVDTVSKLVLA